MANPNGRPPRLGVRAERLTVYVHPDTRRILFERSRQTSRPVGEVIDGMISNANGEEGGRRKLKVPEGFTAETQRGRVEIPAIPPAVEGRRKDIMGHDWGAPQGKYGRPCMRCGLFDKTVTAGLPCSGKGT